MNNIESEELKSLVQRIINSGELGRSKTYAAILSYLVECSLAGTSPKEMAIAVDVLGRDADFDVAKDSIVRVHIYHLRNKLKAYFIKHGKTEKYCIEIPKGQYIVTTTLNLKEEELNKSNLSVSGKPLNRSPVTLWMGAFLGLLLVLNLFVQYSESPQNERIVEDMAFGPWQGILDDEEPILIVLGDYYIFGELDEVGNVSRMVREFNINSLEDLEFEQSIGNERASQYFNLDLSYIPTSSAFALAKIMSLLTDASAAQDERIKVVMMSSLSTADLVGNHIVYIGFLSGLGRLEDRVFASSGLAIGSTYDELYSLETGEFFSSSSGLSIGENNYLDYGMISSLALPNDHQLIMVAGMRDEGLVNVSEEATSLEAWSVLEQSLTVDGSQISKASTVYEALYEVSGFDSINFEADLIYSKALDTEAIR